MTVCLAFSTSAIPYAIDTNAGRSLQEQVAMDNYKLYLEAREPLFASPRQRLNSACTNIIPRCLTDCGGVCSLEGFNNVKGNL